MSFVLVQHLDPKHLSHLGEILQRSSKMPVVEAADGMKAEADHVYITPPNVQMRIANRLLHLTPRPKTGGVYLPINEFFYSLAAECDGKAIGVVLSGTANDGTAGLQAIKASGGITFAQDETSAKYPGMPHSAVKSGCVDFVFRPAKIAEELARIGAHPFVAKSKVKSGKPHEEALKRIYQMLKSATGVDFSQYKQTTINRRIQRRLSLIHI